MKAHELAKQLLELPNFDVAIYEEYGAPRWVRSTAVDPEAHSTTLWPEDWENSGQEDYRGGQMIQLKKDAPQRSVVVIR